MNKQAGSRIQWAFLSYMMGIMLLLVPSLSAMPPDPPMPPTNLRQVANISSSSISLKWTASITSGVSYQLQYWAAPSASPVTVNISAGITNYTISSGLSSNTVYRAKVRSVKSGYYSIYTGTVNVITDGSPVSATNVDGNTIVTEPGRLWAPRLKDTSSDNVSLIDVLDNGEYGTTVWTPGLGYYYTIMSAEYDADLGRNCTVASPLYDDIELSSKAGFSSDQNPILNAKIKTGYSPWTLQIECAIEFNDGTPKTATLFIRGGAGTDSHSSSNYYIYLDLGSAYNVWQRIDVNMINAMRGIDSSIGRMSTFRITSAKIRSEESIKVSDFAFVRTSTRIVSESLSPAGDSSSKDIIQGHSTVITPSDRTGNILCEISGYDQNLNPIHPKEMTIKVVQNRPPTLSDPVNVSPPGYYNSLQGIHLTQDSQGNSWVFSSRTSRYGKAVLELAKYDPAGNQLGRRELFHDTNSSVDDGHSVHWTYGVITYMSGSTERVMCVYFRDNQPPGGLTTHAFKQVSFPVNNWTPSTSHSTSGTLINYSSSDWLTASSFNRNFVTNADRTTIYMGVNGAVGITNRQLYSIASGTTSSNMTPGMPASFARADGTVQPMDLQWFDNRLHLIYVTHQGKDLIHTAWDGSSWSTTTSLETQSTHASGFDLYSRPKLSVINNGTTDILIASYMYRQDGTGTISAHAKTYSGGSWTTSFSNLNSSGYTPMYPVEAMLIGDRMIGFPSTLGLTGTNHYLPVRKTTALGTAFDLARLNSMDGSTQWSPDVSQIVPSDNWTGLNGLLTSSVTSGRVYQNLLQWSLQQTKFEGTDITTETYPQTIEVDYRAFEAESAIYDASDAEIVLAGDVGNPLTVDYTPSIYPVLSGNPGSKNVSVSYRRAGNANSRSWPFSANLLLNLPPLMTTATQTTVNGTDLVNPLISWNPTEYGKNDGDLDDYFVRRYEDGFYPVATTNDLYPTPDEDYYTAQPIAYDVADSTVTFEDLGAFDTAAPSVPVPTVPTASLLGANSLTVGWAASTDSGSAYRYFVESRDTRGLVSDLLGSERRMEDSAPEAAPPSSLFQVSGGTNVVTVSSDDSATTPGYRCLKFVGALTTATLMKSAGINYSHYTQYYASGLVRNSSAGAKLVAECLNSGGSVIGSASAASTATAMDTAWTTVGVTFTAPAGTTRIRLKVSNEGNATGGKIVYWDDLALKPVIPVTLTSGVGHYELYFSPSSTPETTDPGPERLFSVGATTTSLRAQNIPDGQYYVHLRAVDRSGNASGWTTFKTDEDDPHLWTIDTTPPAEPVLESVTAETPGESPTYIGGDFWLDGYYPNEWDSATTTVVVRGYARLSDGSGDPILLGAQTLTVAEPPAQMDFSINAAASELEDGLYDFYVTASDQFGGVGSPLNNVTQIPNSAPIRNIAIDNTAPSFAGLIAALPDDSQDPATSNTLVLHWLEATDAPFGNQFHVTYEMYATSETLFAGTETTEDVLVAKFAADITAATTLSQSIEHVDRHETRRWAVVARDLAGNRTSSTLLATRIVYGEEDFSISWNKDELATTDFHTTLSLTFSPAVETAEEADMLLTGSDIELTGGVTHAWVPYATPAQLILSVTGQDQKRVYAQARDVDGNVSFQMRDGLVFHEPAVMWTLELFDSSNDPIPHDTMLDSQETIDAHLEVLDQYGDPFLLEGHWAEFSLQNTGSPSDALQIVDTIAASGELEIKAWKLGSASLKVRHSSLSRLTTTKLFRIDSAGPLDGIAVTPAGPLRIQSGSRNWHFSARGRDAAGNDVPIDPVWSAPFVGTINRTGNLLAVATNDQASGSVTVHDEDNPSILGSAAVVVDGRPPLVEEAIFTPGEGMAEGELTTGTHTLSLQIPAPESADGEGSLPATYDIYIDSRAVGRMIQTTASATLLSGDPAIQFDTAQWPTGQHLLEVRTRDALGNSNTQSGRTIYRQNFRTIGETATISGLDWLLVNQNLDLDSDFYGTWLSTAGRNPGAGGYEPGADAPSAAIQETATALITLLDYNPDYRSMQNNAYIGQTVTVRESIQGAIAPLIEIFTKNTSQDPLTKLFAAEAILKAIELDRRRQGKLLEGEFNTDATVVMIRGFLLGSLKPDGEGGLNVSDDRGASRLASVMAIRVALVDRIIVPPATQALLDRMYVVQSGRNLLDYLRRYHNYSQPSTPAPITAEDGWTLSQWDTWNENGSLFVASELLRMLADYNQARGASPETTALMADAAEFLLESRLVDPGFADPLSQLPESDATPSTPTAVSTALSLLGLQAAHLADAGVLQEGRAYLKELQDESDNSWNHRGYDTALVMRLVRPDLVVESVEYTGEINSLGFEKLVVTIHNQGVEPAGPFVVTLHDADVSQMGLEQRLEHEIGDRTASVLTLAADATTTVSLAAAKAAGVWWIMADSWDAITETDESNNMLRTVPPQEPDLTIKMDPIRFGSIVGGQFQAGPVKVGASWAVRVIVRNIGPQTVPAGQARVTLFKDDLDRNPSAEAMGSSLVTEALAANGAFAVVFALGPNQSPYTIPGLYWVGASVDCGTIHEIRTNNNRNAAQVLIGDGVYENPADLEIRAAEIEIEPGQPAAQAPFQARLTIHNLGDQPVFNPQIQMTVDGRFPQVFTYEGMVPGRSAVVKTFSVALPSPGGELGFVVDPPSDDFPNGRFLEPNETNNAAVRWVTVDPGSVLDLAVAPLPGDFELSKNNDGSWRIKARVRNVGQITYTGAGISNVGQVRASLVQNGQETLLGYVSLGFPITPGSSYLASWNTDLLVNGETNHIHFEIERFTDFVVQNNSADCYLSLPAVPEPVNLMLENLRATPASATLTSENQTEFTFSLEFTVTNDSAIDVDGSWIELTALSGGELRTLATRNVGDLDEHETKLISIQDVPLPPGVHEVCARVHAPYTETTQDDNQACLPLSVTDGVERELSDLAFQAGSGRIARNGTLEVIQAVITNRPLAAAAGSFKVRAVDTNSTSTVIAEITVSGLPSGAARLITLTDIVTTTETRGVTLLVDALDDVQESDEANNSYELTYQFVPAPVLVGKSSILQANRITWTEPAGLGSGGMLAFEQIAGYRVSRWKAGVQDRVWTVPVHAAADQPYGLEDAGLPSNASFEYRIYTLSQGSGESLPLSVSITTAPAATLSVTYNGTVYSGGTTPVEADREAGNDALVQIHAPGANAVKLYVDYQYVTTLSTSVDNVYATTITLNFGANRVGALPIVTSGTQSLNGAWTNQVILIYQKGIDLFVSERDLQLQGYVGGNWVDQTGLIARSLGAGTLLRIKAQIQNLEQQDSGPFQIEFRYTQTDGLFEAADTTPVIPLTSITNLEGNQTQIVYSETWEKEEDEFITGIDITLDSAQTVDETFEANNFAALGLFDCTQYADILFLLDNSASMHDGLRMESAKQAILAMIAGDQVAEWHRYGLVTYNWEQTLRVPFLSAEEFLDADHQLDSICGPEYLDYNATDMICPWGENLSGLGFARAVDVITSPAQARADAEMAEAVIVLVNDGDSGPDMIWNIAQAADAKRKIEATGKHCSIYTLVVREEGSGSSYYSFENFLAQHSMSSSVDVEVTKHPSASDDNFQIVPHGTAKPNLTMGYGATTPTLSTIYSPYTAFTTWPTSDTTSQLVPTSFGLRNNYLTGLTQILRKSALPMGMEDVTFHVDRPSRVIVLWPLDEETTPAWFRDFRPWDAWDRDVYDDADLSTFDWHDIWINGSPYRPYIRDLNETNRTFTLGYASNHYAVFVMGDDLLVYEDPESSLDQISTYLKRWTYDATPDDAGTWFEFTQPTLCNFSRTDLAVQFYEGEGIRGFVGGVPEIDATDVPLRARVTNQGAEINRNIYVVLSKQWANGSLHPVGNPVPVASTLAPGASVNVEFAWDNTYDPNMEHVVIEVYGSEPDDFNTDNNTDTIELSHSLGDLIDFAWETAGRVNSVAAMSGTFEIGLRKGLDTQLTFEGYVTQANQKATQVRVEPSTGSSFLLPLDADVASTMQRTLDAPAAGSHAFTFLLNNPEDNPEYIREAETDNNLKTFNCNINYIYQDVSVDSVQAVGRDAAGNLLIEAHISRNTPDYLVPGVQVSLYEGVVDLESAATATVRTGTYLDWSEQTSDTVTLQFVWNPAGLEPLTLSVVADPYIDLYETPGTGRDNNIGVLTLEILPGSINLKPESLVAKNGGIGIDEIESGVSADLELNTIYLAGADVATTQTYKVRFWDGYPGSFEARLLGEQFISGHDPNTTETLLQLWDSTGHIERAALYAELDPVDHLADALDRDHPSTVPLTAIQMVEQRGILADFDAEDDAGTTWSLRVEVADPSDWTSRTLLGSTIPSTTTLQDYHVASVRGPLLLSIIASGTTGTLPSFGSDAEVVIRFAGTVDAFTSTTIFSSVSVQLPERSADDGVRALALWVAQDGSAWFANEFHLQDDFNPGGGDSPVVSLSPTRAMTDTRGSVLESNEYDNLIQLLIDVTDPSTQDMETVSLVPEAGVHWAGHPIVMVATARNNLARVEDLSLLSISPAGIDASTTTLLAAPWIKGETRSTTFTVPTVGLSGTVEFTAELNYIDTNPANNFASAEVDLAGSVTLQIGAPNPSVVSYEHDLDFDVSYGAYPNFTGTVLLEIVDPDGNWVADVPAPALQGVAVTSTTTTTAAAWNTALTLPGDYRVRGLLYEEGVSYGLRAVDTGTTFTIVGDADLQARLILDRHYMQANQPVAIAMQVANPGRIEALPASTAVELRIIDSTGDTVTSSTFSLGKMIAGDLRVLRQTFTPDTEGEYQIVLSAVNAVAGKSASDFDRLIVGQGALSPAEDLEFLNPSGDIFDWTNQTTATLAQLNVGSYTLGTEDFAWVQPASRPLTRVNMLNNGSVLHAAGDPNLAANWFASTGDPARRLATDNGRWALLMDVTYDTDGLSNASLPGSTLADSIAIQPGQTYTFSFEAKRSVAEGGLTVALRQYKPTGEWIAAGAPLSIASSAISTGSFTRHEFTMTAQAEAYYLDIVLSQIEANQIEITDLQLVTGTVAAYHRTDRIDQRTNLLENAGFAVDSGINLRGTVPTLDAAADATADNGLADGWIATGGSINMVQNDATLPASLQVIGLHSSLAFDAVATTRTLEQKLIPVIPGSGLAFSAWARHTAVYEISQYDWEGERITAASGSIDVGTSWTLVGPNESGANEIAPLELEDATRYVGLKFVVTDVFDLAAVSITPAESWVSPWAGGWIPYVAQAERELQPELADGPRSAHTRYMTHFGKLSTENLLPLTCDADGNGKADLSSLITQAAVSYAASSSATLSLTAATDGVKSTAVAVPSGTLLEWTVDLSRLMQVDTLRLAGTFSEDLETTIQGSPDGVVWFSVNAGEATSTTQDLLLPVEGAWRFWRVSLARSGGGAFTGSLAELELRGWPVSGDDSVVLDRIPPELTLDLQPDNPTSALALVFSGFTSDTLSRVSRVEYRRDAETWQTVNTNTSWDILLPWSLTLNGIDAGTHLYSFRSLDRAGNVSDITTCSVTVDHTPPTMIIDSPTSFTWTNSPQTLLWHTEADNLLTSHGLLTRTTFADATTTATTSEGASISAEGRYGLDVYGLSTLYEAGPTTSTTFGIDLTSPTVSLDHPDPWIDTFSAGSIEGFASEGALESGVIEVKLRLDGGSWQDADSFTPETGAFASAYSGLALGSHSVEVRAWDRAGNVSAITSSTLSIVVSSAYVELVTIEDQQIEGAAAFNFVRNAHTAIVQADLSSGLLAQGQILADLTGLGGGESVEAETWTTSTAQATWTVDNVFTSPTQGVVSVPVWIVYDSITTGTATGTIYADNTSPTLTLTMTDSTVTSVAGVLTVSSDVGFGAPSAYRVNFNAADLGRAAPVMESGVTITFGTDGTADSQIVAGALANYYAPPFLSKGNGRLFGHAGNGPDATHYMTSGKSSVRLTFPSPQQYVGLLWGSVDDYNTVRFYDGEAEIGAMNGLTVDAAADGDQGADGTFYVNINSEEAFDSIVLSSSNYAFEFDDISYYPYPQDLRIMVYSNPTSQSAILFTGQAHDEVDGSGVRIVEGSIDGGEWVEAASYVSGLGGAFNLPFTDLTDGEHTFRFRAIDVAGNVSTVTSDTIVIDLQAPEVTLAELDDSPSSSVTWAGSITDGEGTGVSYLLYRLDDDEDWTYTTDLDDAPIAGHPTRVTFDLPETLEDGYHTLWAQAVDAVGRVSSLTSTTLLVDTTAPTIIIFDPDPMESIAGTYALDIEAGDEGGVGVDTGSLYYRFEQDGQTTAPLTFVAGDMTSGSYTANVDTWSLLDGPTTLKVWASDLLGNDGDTSSTDANPQQISVVIDNDLPPQAPTGLRAVYTTSSTIQLSWNRSTEGDLDYVVVYRRVAEPGAFDAGDELDTYEEVASEALTNLFEDTVTTTTPGYYEYALRAVDRADNISLWSEIVTPNTPEAPEDLHAIGFDGLVQLQWQSVPVDYVKAYRVYRRLSGSGAFTLIATTDEGEGWAADTYTDASVSNATEYEYLVVALDGADNQSLPSNPAYATPGSQPSLLERKLVMFEESKEAEVGKPWSIASNRHVRFQAGGTTTTFTWTFDIENDLLDQGLIQAGDVLLQAMALISISADDPDEWGIESEEGIISADNVVLYNQPFDSGVFYGDILATLTTDSLVTIRVTATLGDFDVTEVKIAGFYSFYTDNDWDFNDVGMKVASRLELTTDSEGTLFVDRVILDADGIYDGASLTHHLNVAYLDFAGTATYTREYWEAGQDPDLDTPSASQSGLLYDPNDSNGDVANIRLFSNSRYFASAGHVSDGIDGDHVRITLELNEPSENPLADFDRNPFDAWLHVLDPAENSTAGNPADEAPAKFGTGADIHVYDPFSGIPENNRYYHDASYIQNDTLGLNGIYLNLGLIVPQWDWPFPEDGVRLWEAYPDFVGFAQTNRGKPTRNVNWYYNFDPDKVQ